MERVIVTFVGSIKDPKGFHNVTELKITDKCNIHYSSMDTDGVRRNYISTVSDFETKFNVKFIPMDRKSIFKIEIL
jgi:hypothetical protein